MKKQIERTTPADDVLNLLRAYLPAAALGAALELGLFWWVAEEPRTVEEVSTQLGVPYERCRAWLELLTAAGLLLREQGAYTLSKLSRTQILDAYSRETWQLLAQEARERYLAGHDLTLHLGYPGSVWQAQGAATPDYVARMQADPEQARRFTRMSHELNLPVARELAQVLDLAGVRRVLDLGGGSGVVSLALLRVHPHLTALVLDIATVCTVGREIADTTPERARIAYHAADFHHDELPAGFDLVVESKVGVYEVSLFTKIAHALNDGGRLVIVDELVKGDADVTPARLTYAFLNALQDPAFFLPSTGEVWERVVAAGFRPVAERHLSTGETVIEARKE